MNQLLITILLLFSICVDAQRVDKPVVLSHYVFNEFTKGLVKVKSGETYSQTLNYNILTGEMIFYQDEKYMAIQKPENVDTVYVDGRKFITADNKFYELLANTSAPLLVEYTYSVNEPGTSTGYGSTTRTTAASSFKSVINTGGAYDLKLPDDFKVIPGYSYLIFKEGKYQKANSAKQLYKIFPGKKNSIDDLVKKNHTSFTKREDMVMLVKAIES